MLYRHICKKIHIFANMFSYSNLTFSYNSARYRKNDDGIPHRFAAAIPSACRCRMLARSFSAAKGNTCRTISLRNVPITSLPRLVSKSGISITAMSIFFNDVQASHCFLRLMPCVARCYAWIVFTSLKASSACRIFSSFTPSGIRRDIAVFIFHRPNRLPRLLHIFSHFSFE